jgi:hypothetical protein
MLSLVLIYLVVLMFPTALDASAAVTTSLSCGTANATQAAVVTVTVTAGTGTAPMNTVLMVVQIIRLKTPLLRLLQVQ